MGPFNEGSDKHNDKLFLKSTNCSACKNNNSNHSNECKKYRENIKTNTSLEEDLNNNNKRTHEEGSNINIGKKPNLKKDKRRLSEIENPEKNQATQSKQNKIDMRSEKRVSIDK